MTNADGPVQYMARTRYYYRALGYSRDYVWATHDDVPFTRLPKPLPKSRVALITTASPPDFDGVKRVWSGRVSSPPPTLFTDNVAWDENRRIRMTGQAFCRSRPFQHLHPKDWSPGSRRVFTACRRNTASGKPALRTRPKSFLAFVRMKRTWPSCPAMPRLPPDA